MTGLAGECFWWVVFGFFLGSASTFLTLWLQVRHRR